MFVRNIITLGNHDSLLQTPDVFPELRQNVLAGDVLILKNAASRPTLRALRDYLVAVGRNSLPNYLPIHVGCPNAHRINRWDPRAYVKGCFHQFAFFPWNQDIFNLFQLFRPVYQVKNLLTGLPQDQFLSAAPEEDCIARLAFQFYPKGVGGLNRHEDPVDRHQVSATLMTMSVRGEDFNDGGAYVEREDGTLIMLDDLTEPGDVIHVNARVRHGVKTIDPGEKEDWLSFKGRWMLLFAINKLHQTAHIPDSIDLEK